MATDMFIKIGDIKGESIDKKHKDEIQLLSWSWGMSQSGTASMGTGIGAGRANVQDISFTKMACKASPVLMQHCLKGSHIGKVALTCRRAGGDNPLDYYKIELEDAMITSVSTGGSQGGDGMTETVSIAFDKVTVAYQPQSKTGGKEGGEIKMSYATKEHDHA